MDKIIEYIMHTTNNFNEAVFRSIVGDELTEEQIEFLISYCKTTHWNMNRNVLNSLLSGNNEEDNIIVEGTYYFTQQQPAVVPHSYVYSVDVADIFNYNSVLVTVDDETDMLIPLDTNKSTDTIYYYGQWTGMGPAFSTYSVALTVYQRNATENKIDIYIGGANTAGDHYIKIKTVY